VRFLAAVQVLVLLFSWLAVDAWECRDGSSTWAYAQDGNAPCRLSSAAGSGAWVQDSAPAGAALPDQPSPSGLCPECACPCHALLLLSAPVALPALSAVGRPADRLPGLVPAGLVRLIDRPPRLS
jgi:hypothetical protein